MTRPDIEDIYPATGVQDGILFESLLHPELGTYWGQFAYSIPGPLDQSRFRAAWKCVIMRHAALRTRLVRNQDGRLLQVVLRSGEVPWKKVDLRSYQPDEREIRFQEYLQQDRSTAVRPERDSLVRFALFQFDDESHRFVWSNHHSIIDGWSLRLVLQEVVAAYDALAAGTNTAGGSIPKYRDFATWIAAQSWGEAEKFFARYLNGTANRTPLTVSSRPDRAEAQTAGFDDEEILLSAEPTAELVAIARRHRVTLNTVIQACWAVLLYRHAGQRDVTLGVTMSGRSAPVAGIESMVGLFINTLPLRLHVNPTQPFGTWLEEVHQTQTELLHFEHVPLAKVKVWSGVAGNELLFDSLVVYEGFPARAAPERAALRFEPLRSFERTNHPLTLYVVPGERLRIRGVSDPRHFDSDTTGRMMGHLDSILHAVVADPATPIGCLPLLTPAERRRVQVEWNATDAEYPRDRCVHQLFEDQVRQKPEAPAVDYGSRSVSFRELNEQANRIAHFLREQGVGAGDLVAVLMERSSEMVAVLLGIWKAGASYVPLDPTHPPERTAFILSDSHARLVIRDDDATTEVDANDLPPTVNLKRDALRIAAASATDPGPVSETDPAAYVIYTSGSTGRPKGVEVGHRALVNLLHAVRRQPGFGPGDNLLAVTTLSFDISALELFLPLITGGRLTIAPREATTDAGALMRLIKDRSPTVMQATPATWRLLLAGGWPGSSQLRVLCGGEALSSDLARELLPRCASLWNMYGPTETTIWSTCCRIDDPDRISIGRPIENTQAYILDANLEPQPVGVMGELYLGGDGLARGYWNRPELTADQFIPNPFRPGERLYRTGDRARYLFDGCIEFLGRADLQVKLRGFRIELGEIESVLREYPGIRDAVVVVREDSPGDQRLVAYVIASSNSVSTAALRQHLRAKLPDYMSPTAFVWLDRLPLTPNGKTDRTALPAPTAGVDDDDAHIAPRTPLEKQLASVWQDVLQVGRVGIHDDFFELGGHSLLAMQTVTRIQNRVGVTVTLRDFFAAPTVSGLTATITTATEPRDRGNTEMEEGVI